MTNSSYFLDPGTLDLHEILQPWVRHGLRGFSPWLANRFGDLFLLRTDGSVHALRTDTGDLELLAASPAQFTASLTDADNAARVLLVPLVDALLEAGVLLHPGECYGFKIPPLVGGAYDIGNIAPRNLAEYHSFLADFYAQTKDLPDGTRVRIRIA